MTSKTNARIAGFTFLIYIAAGITSLALFAPITRAPGIAAQLAGIAEHVTAVRISIVLALVQNFSALVLAVTMYAITREQDRDLAMLALTCRVAEGISGLGTPTTLGLLWLATATGVNAPDPAAARVLGAFLLRIEAWTANAIFFAVGSTLFSWLLLKGRMVPAVLARLGLLASVILVVVLPPQLAGLLGGTSGWRGAIGWLQWIPMLVFELWLAIWLIVKGVAAHGSQPGAALHGLGTPA